MNSICGLYSLEGRQIENADISRLMNVRDLPVPDVEDRRTMGVVAFGYRGLWITEEDTKETQSPSNTHETSWIVSDARIDNRFELLRTLDDSSLKLEEVSDSALIMKAYRKWGINCARHITGDFAFAIWDSGMSVLFCARDPLGVRPLFYAFDRKTFAFASSVRQLISLPYVDRTLDDDFVADFLARGDCPTERTVYRGIKSVMAGCSISVEHGALKKANYWNFDTGKTIRYKTDEEYEAHFLELFSNAVKARLRARGQVGADLSGGIDSSSIVCMAQEVYGRGLYPDRKIIAYTDLFESAKVRETKWADLVLKKYTLESIRRQADPHMFPADFDPRVDSWDQPTLKVLALPEIRGKGKALSDRGIRVLLSGIGGDQVLLSSVDPCHLADLFRRFRWIQLLREAVRWQQCLSEPVSNVLVEYGLKPVLHPNAMWALRKASEGILPWIDPAFNRKFNIQDRMLHKNGFLPPHFWSVAQQRHYLGIMRTSAALVEGPMMRAPVEVRYPYLDRELAEFALAIPLEQKIRPQETRSIVRRGLRGILPEAVRVRRSKGWFGESLFSKLARDRRRFEKWIEDSRAATYGYLDRVEFLRELERALVGYSRNGYLFIAALSLEVWMQGNEFLDVKWQLEPTKGRVGDDRQDELSATLAHQMQKRRERKEVRYEGE